MLKHLIILGLLILQTMVFSGCGRKEQTPGQKLDEAIQKAGEAVEEAGREMQEAGAEK